MDMVAAERRPIDEHSSLARRLNLQSARENAAMNEPGSPSEVVIRPARVEDIDAISRVQVDASLDAYSGILPSASIEIHTLNTRSLQWMERLSGTGDTSRSVTLVAQVADEVVGFIDAGPDRSTSDPQTTVAEVATIYVDSSQWRQGLGAELMHSAALELAAAGYDEAFLYVLADNERACHFYEALGWTRAGERESDEAPELVEVRYSFVLRRGRSK